MTRGAEVEVLFIPMDGTQPRREETHHKGGELNQQFENGNPAHLRDELLKELPAANVCHCSSADDGTTGLSKKTRIPQTEETMGARFLSYFCEKKSFKQTAEPARPCQLPQ